MCNCTCNKLFYASDFQQIGTALLQQSAFDIHRNQEPPHIQVNNFMAWSMVAGLHAIQDITSAVANNAVNSQQQQVYEDGLFYDAVSELMVHTRASQLDSRAIQLLHMAQFGRKTRVELPGGQSFDT